MSALIQLPFDEACKVKYEMGRREHRQAATDEFQGDPIVEFYMEQLDSWNYLLDMEKRGITVSPFRFASIRANAEWARELRP